MGRLLTLDARGALGYRGGAGDAKGDAMRLTAFLVPWLLGLVLLCGCESKLSEENYDAVTVGMRLDQVERILGRGEEQTISGVSIGSGGDVGRSGANSQKTYVWKEDNGNEISIVFADDKVVSKNKRGF
jgi:hypothetical protein